MTSILKFAFITFAVTAGLSSLPAVSLEETPSEVLKAGTVSVTDISSNGTRLIAGEDHIESKEIAGNPSEIRIVSGEDVTSANKKIAETDITDAPSLPSNVVTLKYRKIRVSGKIYANLLWIEQNFIIKKILELEWGLFKNIFYKRNKIDQIDTGGKKEVNELSVDNEAQEMNENEKEAFLQEVQRDFPSKLNIDKSLKTLLQSMILKNIEENEGQIMKEFVPRFRDFYGEIESRSTNYILKGLDKNQFDLLITNFFPLAQTQLRELSLGVTINGEGWIWHKASEAGTSTQNDLICNLFSAFVVLCDSPGASFKYPNYNTPYIELAALIFWKNVFRNIENEITKDDLFKLQDNLSENVQQIFNSRVWVSERAEKLVRGSRYEVLVETLKTYINKFYPL